MQPEIWRKSAAPGYEVSSLGNVRNTKGKLLTLKSKDSEGYYRVRVGGRIVRVHILVAAAFLGPRPDGHVCDHRDQNRTNNEASNLRYVTKSVNSINARSPKRSPKVEPYQLELIHRLRQCGYSQRQVAEVIRVRRETVSKLERKYQQNSTGVLFPN